MRYRNHVRSRSLVAALMIAVIGVFGASQAAASPEDRATLDERWYEHHANLERWFADPVAAQRWHEFHVHIERWNADPVATQRWYEFHANQNQPAQPAPQSQPEPQPEPQPQSQVEGSVWDRLAQCESGGNWSINTGNPYSGGLQFLPSTWNGYGGGEFAPAAHQATRAQQIVVAERVLDGQGWGAWPACSAQLGLR